MLNPADILLRSFKDSNSRLWSNLPLSIELDVLDRPDIPKGFEPKVAFEEIDGKLQSVKTSSQQQNPETLRENWIERLEQIQSWATEKIDHLSRSRDSRFKPATELKYDLVQELTYNFLQHSPNHSLLAKDYSTTAPTPYVEFIRKAIFPITTTHESLIEQIKQAKKSSADFEKFDASTGVVFL